MNKLFVDCKTDEEKYDFFLSGRAHETGVIAASLQADVAMAYQRCISFQSELRRLNEVNAKLRNALLAIREYKFMPSAKNQVDAENKFKEALRLLGESE